MEFPRADGDAFTHSRAMEKAAIETKKMNPTRIPTFQALNFMRLARKLQEMKLAARQAGQGMDKTQKVFLEISL